MRPSTFWLRPAPPPGARFFSAPRPLRPRAPANPAAHGHSGPLGASPELRAAGDDPRAVALRARGAAPARPAGGVGGGQARQPHGVVVQEQEALRAGPPRRVQGRGEEQGLVGEAARRVVRDAVDGRAADRRAHRRPGGVHLDRMELVAVRAAPTWRRLTWRTATALSRGCGGGGGGAARAGRGHRRRSGARRGGPARASWGPGPPRRPRPDVAVLDETAPVKVVHQPHARRAGRASCVGRARREARDEGPGLLVASASKASTSATWMCLDRLWATEAPLNAAAPGRAARAGRRWMM